MRCFSAPSTPISVDWVAAISCFLFYFIESFSFKSWHCPCNCNPLVSSCQSGAGSTCKLATKLGWPFGLFHLPIRFFAKGSVVLVEFPYWSCCFLGTSWYSVSLRIFGTARMYIIIHIRMHIHKHIHIRTQCVYIYMIVSFFKHILSWESYKCINHINA